MADGRFPVSVKGVLMMDGKVVLLKNRRDEWELPGGRLETGETPEDCVAREIAEELNLHVEVGPLLDAWVYRLPDAGDVFIVAYGCSATDFSMMYHSAEHTAAGTFHPDELDSIVIPNGYKKAIKGWAGHQNGARP